MHDEAEEAEDAEKHFEENFKKIKTTNHFNYYAFEGLSGELRWKHQVIFKSNFVGNTYSANFLLSVKFNFPALPVLPVPLTFSTLQSNLP